MSVIHIFNTDCVLYDFPNEIIDLLDNALRYPTEHASSGWRAPEAAGGGGWDGWVRFVRRWRDGRVALATGLLGNVHALLARAGASWEYVDHRVRPDPGVPDRGPIDLRGYQTAAVDTAEAVGFGVLDMVPRAGKTRVACELHRRLSLPTLWVVPTSRIAKQTVTTFEGFFGAHYAMQLVGQSKAPQAAHMHVVVCTAATAAGLSPEFLGTRQVLIADEFHHSAAPTFRKFLRNCHHIYHRYGLTGTHYRSGDDELAMRSVLGNVVARVTSQDLVDLGYLVPADVLFFPVNARRLRGLPPTFIGGHGKFGIHEHDERNATVAQVAAALTRVGKRVLVLVGTKEQGRRLFRLLDPLLHTHPRAQYRAVEFVSADMPKPRINGIFDDFNARQSVQALIGTSLMGEGVDLPPADALVLARGESAKVNLVQAAYRVCTQMPGKRRAVIVDFADRHHRKLLQHSLARFAVYHQEPTFSVRVLQGADDFLDWLLSQPIG